MKKRDHRILTFTIALISIAVALMIVAGVAFVTVSASDTGKHSVGETFSFLFD